MSDAYWKSYGLCPRCEANPGTPCMDIRHREEERHLYPMDKPHNGRPMVKFDPIRVKVELRYEVFCEECNCNPFAEGYVTRLEAVRAQRAHVAHHEREG